MRASRWFFVAMVLAAPLAWSGEHSESTFAWRDGGRALSLHSEDGGGTWVTEASPEPVLGLRRGDLIVDVDGRPVRRLDALAPALERSRGAATVRVRRNGKDVMLHWSRAEIRVLVPTPHAAPATPPPPPPSN